MGEYEILWAMIAICGIVVGMVGLSLVKPDEETSVTTYGAMAMTGGLLLIVLALAFGAEQAFGRDLDGRYANSPLKQWFDSLKSGKGPCCSDADGSAVSDVDWETKDGHYRVRLDGEWLDVPDDAVITEPNRAGRTMVWPMRGYMGVSIRCFMPGSMT